jgi:hypothetical protein
MSTSVAKLISSKVISQNPAEFIGNPGDLWIQEDEQIIRMSDGQTPGGVTIGSGNTVPTNYPTISITSVGDSGYFGAGGGNVTYVAENTLINPVASPSVGGTGIVFISGSNTGLIVGNAVIGAQTITFDTGQPGTNYVVMAYAETKWGTIFSTPKQGTSGLCLIEGTVIALSNGLFKKIEDIEYNDKLLVWDFDNGQMSESEPLWIKKEGKAPSYNLLTFSDGTILKTFDQHRIFNKQKGKFTYPMTDETPIGTITYNQYNEEVKLTDKRYVMEPVSHYNVITNRHINMFANTILTSCRFNNLYPIKDMKFVKDNRQLRLITEFNNIPLNFFDGLRISEQLFETSEINWYVARLIKNDVNSNINENIIS